MNNSKFWNSEATSPKIAKINKFDFRNIKGLGTTGLVILSLVAAFGIFAYLVFINPALALMSSFKVVKEDGAQIAKDMADRDLVALDKTLNKFDADLKSLSEERDKRFGWAKNAKLFKLSEFYSDSDHFINAGYYASAALREIDTVVRPFADAAGLKVSEAQEVPQQLGLMEAFQSWVRLMPQVAGQMDGVIEKVTKVGKEFEQINTAKYPENLGSFALRSNLEFAKRTLSNVGSYGPDIKQALTIFPRILGVGTTEKRYMIIMQNDKELRPTGGFMTNYATFKIRDALLQSDFSSKDMYSIDHTLDIIDATYDFPDPPAAYTKYLKVERWYARDMNSSPDFIVSMDQFLKFYNLAGRLDPYEIKAVDGIVAINTNVVRELLEVTGPVTVSGVTYTKDNVVLELEKIASLELREQVNRKKVLGDLMEAMLVNVFQSDKNLWSKIIDKSVSLALRKHVLVYLFDAEGQALVEKYNFAGRIIADTPGDYAAVISTNLGGDKTNWFTNKKVTHTLVKEGDKWVRTIQVDYKYTKPGDEFAPFVGRFKDWLRVYVPIGSQVISVEGSEDGTVSDQELNKTYFTGYVELGVGEAKTLKFKYYLPAGKVNDNNYSLTLQKQPGIDSEIHVVEAAGKKQEITLDKDTVVNFKLK